MVVLRRSEVLIATLGLYSQVVTLALDLLLEQGHQIGEVVVIHTSDVQPRIRDALLQLAKEFSDGKYLYKGLPCRYSTVQLECRGVGISDPRTSEETGAVFRTIYQLVQSHKRRGHRLHVSIAGGRKNMSVYGMAAAQILFDADDRLWHLLSDPVFERANKMHRQKPSDAQLVRIPVLAYSSFSPLGTLLVTDDPWLAVTRQQDLATQRLWEERRVFVEEKLTNPQRIVVERMMRDMLVERQSNTAQALARKLYLSPKTVERRLSDIYKKLHEYLQLDESATVDRTMLVAFLTPYFQKKLR